MFDDHIEALIERFFDDALTSAERAELDALAASDPAIKRRLEDDAMVRSLLQSASPRQFSPAFLDLVVHDVAEEEKLINLLAAHKTQGFKPFFEQRVMGTIEAEHTEKDSFFNREVSDLLSRLFPRFTIPVAAAASLAMVANASAAAAGAPLIEALIGLPSEQASAISFLVVG